MPATAEAAEQPPGEIMTAGGHRCPAGARVLAVPLWALIVVIVRALL